MSNHQVGDRFRDKEHKEWEGTIIGVHKDGRAIIAYDDAAHLECDDDVLEMLESIMDQ